MLWSYLIDIPWVIFIAYWILAAFDTRKTAKKESFIWRFGIMFMIVFGFSLLFRNHADTGFLGQPIFPRSDALRALSVVLVWAGIALAIWARWHLGQYWSGRVTIKEDHKLIRTGPYARLRHPYTPESISPPSALHWPSTVGEASESSA